MKPLSADEIEMLLPYEMYNALRDRHDWNQPKTASGKLITFEEYLSRFGNNPLALLDDYLEWEGILGYYQTLKSFFLRLKDNLK